MNTGNYKTVELPLAFRLAENLVRKRSPKAWLTLSFLIPRPRLKYLFLCYAYLRWVDNLIDNKIISIDEKKKFINKQIELAATFSYEKDAIPKTNQEAFLFYFLLYAIKHKKPQLINELKNMLEAMRMDVCRLEQKGIFDAVNLARYFTFLNKAMFDIVHSFMYPEKNCDGKYENLGEIFWGAGTLRDFKKDLECGYINISKEDLNNYKIDIEHYHKDENLKKWLKNRIVHLFELLEGEVKILIEMPLKIRLFWAIAYPFYLHKIIRINMYGYTLDYESKFHFLKEIKSVIAALTLGIKTIIKIIFKIL